MDGALLHPLITCVDGAIVFLSNVCFFVLLLLFVFYFCMTIRAESVSTERQSQSYTVFLVSG